MEPKIDEQSIQPKDVWLERVREKSHHNTLSKLVVSTLKRFQKDGTIETTVNSALMRSPDGHIVSFMRCISELGITPYDIDNGNLILTNVTVGKMAVIMEERFSHVDKYKFSINAQTSNTLSKLGFQSYLSLPIDELLDYHEKYGKYNHKLYFSNAKKFKNSGKAYSLAFSVINNFKRQTEDGEVVFDEDFLDQVLGRIRAENIEPIINKSSNTIGGRVEMYLDEIPGTLINYFKLIELKYKVYMNRDRYDLFDIESTREFVRHFDTVIKYNR